MVVPFSPMPPPNLRGSAKSSTPSSLSSPQRAQLQSWIDRYQVLALKNPRLARWLGEWLTAFLAEHGG